MTKPTLVLRPEFGFAEMEAALARLGWARTADTSAAPPLVAGEPEFASFEGRGGRASYTFNPVVRLRVLVFRGERAADACAEAARALPALDHADLRRLLSAEDPRTLLLGILAARALRSLLVADLLEELCGHAHARVAAAAREAHEELGRTLLEAGVERLREEQRRRPLRSALFPRLGDARTRAETVRWLMRDRSESNEEIEKVLRSALGDEDWEVRAAAMIAAARLGASALWPEVRRLELPRTSREGLDETDRSILHAARKAALDILAGKPEGDVEEYDDRAALRRHVRRCVAGHPAQRHDRIYRLISFLADPREPDDEEEEDETPA